MIVTKFFCDQRLHLEEPPRINVIEVGLIKRVFANNLACLILSQDKLAGAPCFVCMRAFKDRRDCDVLCLPRQDVNLFELFKPVRVVMDQRVQETAIQLSRVLDVERVA